jgi:glycosyltransferase involved in cell wall biosynthesis
MIIGITRVCDESLIIADTIGHFLEYCDHIVLYDDRSTDNTVEIAMSVGKARISVIHGDSWRADRRAEETRHRALLLDAARNLGADWCLCFDADERLVGELPILEGNGYRFGLFDGYLTQDHQDEYISGGLAGLPRMWGTEYRDILMLFRANTAKFVGLDRREPIVSGTTLNASVVVKHFGKCISVEQWEDTCDYYATHFPEPYRTKWNNRRGKAMHTASDFGRPLLTWEYLMSEPDLWVKI